MGLVASGLNAAKRHVGYRLVQSDHGRIFSASRPPAANALTYLRSPSRGTRFPDRWGGKAGIGSHDARTHLHRTHVRG